MDNTDIIRKLIGPVEPYGHVEIDEKLFENLKEMCQVVDNLIGDIESVSANKDSQLGSKQEMGKYAYRFLVNLTGNQ
jgi:hypothetical protein